MDFQFNYFYLKLKKLFFIFDLNLTYYNYFQNNFLTKIHLSKMNFVSNFILILIYYLLNFIILIIVHFQTI